MSPPDATPVPSPLDGLFDGRGFDHDAAAGTSTNPAGERVTFATPSFLRGLHHVLHAEKSGAWPATFKQCGVVTGRQVAVGLDAEFARRGQPALGALPLETSLLFIENYFASHGWGLLKLDLADAAEHGLVTAHLQHGYFAEAFGDAAEFVDPLLAGVIQGFFEHVSGVELGCDEIACVRRGAPECIFVVTAAERLATVAPLLGRATAAEIIARLKA